MANVYVYKKQNEPDQLRRQIEAKLELKLSGAEQVGYLETADDNIKIVMDKALTTTQKSLLDEVVRDHVAIFIDSDKVYWARVVSFSASAKKPLKVDRIYGGKEIEIDCYITEQIKELYQAGKLTAGDYVLVQFIDGDPDKPCAILKAHKTW